MLNNLRMNRRRFNRLVGKSPDLSKSGVRKSRMSKARASDRSVVEGAMRALQAAKDKAA